MQRLSVRSGRFWALALGSALILGFGTGMPSASQPVRSDWVTQGAPTATTQGGLHNVFWPAPHVISGSAPESDADFEAMKALGVRSVVSVDGTPPDVAAAKRAGLRYVHVPLQYGGVDAVQRALLSQALHELPAPIYVHCHHGKHRGPAAVAVAGTALGWWSAAEAVQFLERAGTAKSYPGLYEAVRATNRLSAEELAQLLAELPEVARVSDLAKAMVAVDAAADHLEQIRKAGWKTPADHPDLVPAAEAGRITELFRGFAPTSQPIEGDAVAARWFAAAKVATALEAAIADGKPEQCDAAYKALREQCTTCHRAERDGQLRVR